MGLDITAYRKLTKIDADFDSDGEPIDPQTKEPLWDSYKPYLNPDFPGRGQGLEAGAVYSYAESADVFSRPYGAYNRWRETLAKLAGYPLGTYERWGVREQLHAASAWNGDIIEAPFYEIVNFSDCEGAIGPVVSAKLLRDFIEWDERAKEVGDDRFYEAYSNLRRGLELAADGGALHFH